jgi:hypothetical protein
MSRRLIGVVALVSAALAAACDSGPKGPGTLNATVTGPQALGAVVLELGGGTVQGVTGQGSAQVYSASLGGDTQARYRLVVVAPTGADLRFGIEVTDLGAAAPTVTVVSAANTSNVPIPPGGMQVRIER